MRATATTAETAVLTAAATHRYGRVDYTVADGHDPAQLRASMRRAGWTVETAHCPDPDGVTPGDAITDAGRRAAGRPDTIITFGQVVAYASGCGCLGNALATDATLTAVQWVAVCGRHWLPSRRPGDIDTAVTRLLEIEPGTRFVALRGLWVQRCGHTTHQPFGRPVSHYCGPFVLPAQANIPPNEAAARADRDDRTLAGIRAATATDTLPRCEVTGTTTAGQQVDVIEEVRPTLDGMHRGESWVAVVGPYRLHAAVVAGDGTVEAVGTAVPYAGGRVVASSTTSAHAALREAQRLLEAGGRVTG